MDEEGDTHAMIGLGFLVFLFVPFFLINFSLYLSQPVVLPPVEIHGKIGNPFYYEYPTSQFPLTCFFPELSHVNKSIPMIYTIKENRLYFVMPIQQTQIHITYLCKPFYNATTMLNLYPERQAVDTELIFWIIFFTVLFAFPFGYIFMLFSREIDERKKRNHSLLQ